MARLQTYTQQQLASSVVGVPGVDRSGEILAGALQKVAGDFANFQIQNLQRRTAAEDSLAINAIGKSRDVAKDDMQLFMVKNRDPATWENGWNTIIQRQQKEFIGKTLTRDAAANERVNQKAFELGGRQIVQIAATEQTIKNDIEATGETMYGVLSDPLSTDLQRRQATDNHRSALLGGNEENVADVHLEELTREAEKDRNTNANTIAREFAANNSTLVSLATPDELRNLPQFSSLTSVSIEAIQDYAKSVGVSSSAAEKQAGLTSIADKEITFSEILDNLATDPKTTETLLATIEDWDLTLLPDSVKDKAVNTKEQWRKNSIRGTS